MDTTPKKPDVSYRFKGGKTYIISEKTGSWSMELFKNVTLDGKKKLLVTDISEEDIGLELIKDADVLFVSTKRGDNGVPSWDLDALQYQLLEFMGKDTSSIIFLEALGSLIERSKFKKVEELLMKLNEAIEPGNVAMLISIDSRYLTEQEEMLLRETYIDLTPVMKINEERKEISEMIEIAKNKFHHRTISEKTFEDINKDYVEELIKKEVEIRDRCKELGCSMEING
jgi:hypothetical protein